MNFYLAKSIAAGLIALGCLAAGAALCAEEPQTADWADRWFWADVSLFSLNPGSELASYRSLGDGGVGPGGTLGTGTSGKERDFEVSVRGELKAQRFLATVEVTPDGNDKRTQPQKVEYDLSDLQPRTLEIARDDDGRTYRLNVNPKVMLHPVTQFRTSELRLDCWQFDSSPVILNDLDYLGQLSMGGNQIASCDVAGFAKIEFSLLHLKDAAPLGRLKDGVINIAKQDGTRLRISNVKNGSQSSVLPGGPYIVWVRWNKPTQSLDEYRRDLKEMIADFKQRASAGDVSMGPGVLARLEKVRDSDRVEIIQCGLRMATADELAEPQ